MRPLVAVGGLIVPGEQLGGVQKRLEIACAEAGFPDGEEFKWSPGKDQWMRANLIRHDRRRFFEEVLMCLAESGVEAVVVLEDVESTTATGASTPEEDVVVLFLERIANRLRETSNTGIVLTDRPGGGRSNEDAFLEACSETVQRGTRFVDLRDVILGVYSAPSNLSRLLQAADVVTGCTTALVAGEAAYAPEVFATVKQLLPRKHDRVGGTSLKIHPDFRYANLYHWLADDSHFVRYPLAVPLPILGRPYPLGPDTF